jgi:tRNA dimethylallyltransferase
MVDRPNLLAVLGATACGKTALSVSLARHLSGLSGGDSSGRSLASASADPRAEILSADSRQVYRGLDIGSGKDLGEYGEVPYHLIDIVTLETEYSVFDYQRDFARAYADVVSRGRLPLMVGGTGMYLDSVLRGYSFKSVAENPALREQLSSLSDAELVARLLSLKREIHNRTDLEDRARLIRAIEIAEAEPVPADGSVALAGMQPLVLGVHFERSVLRARIRARLEARLGEGLIEEVAGLHESGVSWERLERLGLEYRFTAEYLEGKIPSREVYLESLYIAICQFAKRQETWFRGMERKGVAIEWIESGNLDAALDACRRAGLA